MGSQVWTSPIGLTPAYDAAAYNTSTTLTDVSPVPQVTINAGTLETGQSIRVTARGKFSNTATPTLLLGLYWGGVAGTKLAAIGATTTTTAATNWPFQVDALLTCRSTGTSGSMETSGIVMLGTSLTAMTPIWMDASAIAPVTIDTTVNKTLTLGAQWGASSASNTLTVVQWCVEGIGY